MHYAITFYQNYHFKGKIRKISLKKTKPSLIYFGRQGGMYFAPFDQALQLANIFDSDETIVYLYQEHQLLIKQWHQK